jgi:hypothetical protein
MGHLEEPIKTSAAASWRLLQLGAVLYDPEAMRQLKDLLISAACHMAVIWLLMASTVFKYLYSLEPAVAPPSCQLPSRFPLLHAAFPGNVKVVDTCNADLDNTCKQLGRNKAAFLDSHEESVVYMVS